MKSNQCIIFVLKNDEDFLSENIGKILNLEKKYDLYFVVRESKDRTSEILKINNFVNIELTYDPGYYDSLRVGFEFVKNMKYISWIEFGETKNISIDEINKLNNINEDYDFEKSVIFASRYYTNKRSKKRKFYIYLSIFKKVIDPYSRLRIYNESTFELLKKEFDFKIDPTHFLNLLYKKPNYIEVKTICKKNKITNKRLRTHTSIKFQLFIYSIFVLPFIKRFGLHEY